ncbi:hypothetical protein TVAG_382570 [Trichomonas vaginalis G3]|uniref:Uncharacterized protein n=1 Tax=Trichomonas vaginalis (strain ATCC PRA-98 / G3) TaxID=412133 RepID=A2FBT3_TRIV3|nr:hypothetical protein TVAGG3_0643210 [Trichomonas vaginalis G3]EAX97633.1 hypothetical protein TVAG_382570 [Trichomonas vaginalis G3]KAI5505323.1 hypothetical protein TVAGG3_0643210 [Trichomonas vaginalis G3]|eukprot:XP_001310563.1 hypothetical protein [Trichomonas vaginalis G3]
MSYYQIDINPSSINPGYSEYNEEELAEIARAIELSKREQEDSDYIRRFVSDRNNLVPILSQLPGVKPDDPRFEKFYTQQ